MRAFAPRSGRVSASVTDGSAGARARPAHARAVPAPPGPDGARADALVPAGGQPLEPRVRTDLERRFGHDFARVRIHADTEAARLAEAHQAAAFTVGSDIVFGAGQYRPEVAAGRGVLAHELVHVLQQRRAPAGAPAGTATRGHEPDEVEARTVSDQVLSAPAARASVEVHAPASAPVQRQSIAPAEPAEAFIPGEAELTVKLAAMDVAGRKKFVEDTLADVKAKWQRADAAGLISKLQQVRSAETRMAKSPTQPVAGLPQNQPGAFREGLMLDAGGSAATDLGRKLVTGQVSVDSVAATAATAANAVMNLRRLDDVLTRALSAQAAATATGTPLADVLAMYRTEGDLNAPPSTASLAAGRPSGTHDATSSLSTRPDMSHLVMLLDDAVVGASSDSDIREFALGTWFVQIGGLDEVGKLAAPRDMPFMTWSSDNWLAARGITGPASSPADVHIIDDARQDALARWTRLKANLDIARPTSAAGTKAVMITPRDPEQMVSTILSEAVMRQRALAKTASLVTGAPKTGAGSALTPGMAYLHYHAGTEQMQEILPSAAIAAAATGGSRYLALRKAMQGSLDLTSMRASMKKIDDNTNKLATPLAPAQKTTLENENTTLRADMWTRLQAWLKADNTRIGLLGDFVETADTTLWSSWQEHRGNLSRYNVLRAYYSML